MLRGDRRLQRDVVDSLNARAWLDEQQAAGRFRSVVGPIAMLITVKDPVRVHHRSAAHCSVSNDLTFIELQAVAYMVEGAVGGVKALLGYIATNERVTTRTAPYHHWYPDVAHMHPLPRVHTGRPRNA
jgi:hypothetical protein